MGIKANGAPTAPVSSPTMLALLKVTTGYRLLFLVHILAAIVAFGPLFMYPRLQRAGETQAIAKLHMRMVFPALVVVWVVGMGMAGVGEIDLAETWWVTVSIVIWLAMVVVSWFLIRPAVSDVSDGARSKMSAGIGVTHLLLVVTLYMMIFQPGDTVVK
jgi:hypothetical protein